MSRFETLVRRVDERGRGIDLPLMSVSQFRGVIRRSELADGPPRAESLDDYKICRTNDIVFNKMSIRDGAMGVAPEDGLVTYHYEVLRPHPGVDPRFVMYLMKSHWFTGELIKRERGIGAGGASGVRTTEVPFSVLRTIDAPIPSPDGQAALADFLDRETAQIDALIEAQRDLVGLLEDRKSAVLDAAFQPFRSRTIELRRAVTLVTSGSRGWAEYYTDEGERFLRIGNLSRGSLDLRGEIQHVDLPARGAEGARTQLRFGDLLFSITAYLGSVGIVDSDWVGAYVSQHIGLCRLDPATFDPRFVGYYMLSPDGQHQLKEGAYGGAKMQLALGDLLALAAPVADLDDQRSVVASIDGRLASMNALIDAAIATIATMQERRSALISAAVTGRIDPRTGKEVPEKVLEFA